MHLNTSKHDHLRLYNIRLYNIVLNEINIQPCKVVSCDQVSCKLTSTSKVEKNYENKHYQNSKDVKSVKEFWNWIDFVFRSLSLCIYIFFFFCIEVFFAIAYDFYPPYLSIKYLNIHKGQLSHYWISQPSLWIAYHVASY